MKSVEKTGKTIDEAIQAALVELGVGRDEVEVEVLEEPNKGLFGLLGSKLAKVKVTVKIDPAKEAVKFLRSVCSILKTDAQISSNYREEYLCLNLTGSDLGLLIGKRGDTLNALQYLTNLVVNKKSPDKVKILLDIEGYRERREKTLINLAKRLSEKVKRTGNTLVLEPMNPQERRIIHTTLQNDPMVETFSEGEEPYRKVVISIKKFVKKQ